MPLYIVPTPIGNLADITFRAIEILKNADVIYAEDTRTSKKLLNHYSIKGRLESFHKHNEHIKLNSIMRKLEQKNNVAVISDAGTPGISDPGFLLVRESIVNGFQVFCLPGPTALIPAIIQSGFPTDRFVVEGFLPIKKGRKKRLEELANEQRTVILYESPHRILKSLKQFVQFFDESREISIVRELTKKFETQFRGSICKAIEFYEKNKPKGEFVICISSLKEN